MISIDDLYKLNKAGIDFSAHLFDGNYILSSKEVLEYVKDPELLEAKKHGVDLADWKKWKDHCKNPCCQALTKKGKPCKGYVKKLSLQDFIKKGCSVYCGIHEHTGSSRTITKRKKPRDTYTKKMIARVNNTVLSEEEMLMLVRETGLLDPKDRDFEGCAITAIRIFNSDEDKAFSITFRMRALALLVKEGIPGWTGLEQPDGAIMTHKAIFIAAGIEPLIGRGRELVFDRKAFLRRVFQLAKNLASAKPSVDNSPT